MDKPKKHAGGRPKKYTDDQLDLFQKKIDQYFESCFNPIVNKQGELVRDEQGKVIKTQVRPFTMSGLAYALDMDRKSLLGYKGNPKFLPAITRARNRCEVYAEERLFDKDGCLGAKFSLINNYDNWHDKAEVEHGLTDNLIDRLKDLPVPELLKKANALISATGTGTTGNSNGT